MQEPRSVQAEDLIFMEWTVARGGAQPQQVDSAVADQAHGVWDRSDLLSLPSRPAGPAGERHSYGGYAADADATDRAVVGQVWVSPRPPFCAEAGSAT
jgi:hypothetical protein